MRFLSMFSFWGNLIWWNVHRKIVDSRDRFEVLMHSPRKQHFVRKQQERLIVPGFCESVVYKLIRRVYTAEEGE